MQRIVSASAGEVLEITIDRGGVGKGPQGDADAKEVKDNFGNVQRVGILGISRSMAPRISNSVPSLRSRPFR